MVCANSKCKKETDEKMPGCEHVMCRPCFLSLRDDECPACGAGWDYTYWHTEATRPYRINKYLIVRHCNKRLAADGEPNVFIQEKNNWPYPDACDTLLPWDPHEPDYLIECNLGLAEDAGFEQIRTLRENLTQKLLDSKKNCLKKFDEESKMYFFTTKSGKVLGDYKACGLYAEEWPLRWITGEKDGVMWDCTCDIPNSAVTRAATWYAGLKRGMTPEEYDEYLDHKKALRVLRERVKHRKRNR